MSKDKNVDKPFYGMVKDRASGEVLYKSIPCATEEEAKAKANSWRGLALRHGRDANLLTPALVGFVGDKVSNAPRGGEVASE